MVNFLRGKVQIKKQFMVLLDQFRHMVIVENLFLMYRTGMNLVKLEALLVRKIMNGY